MKPKKRSTLLPIKIVKKVEELKLSTKKKQYAFKMLDLIINDFLDEELAFEEYRDYPCKYWKKAVCEHYETIVLVLEIAQIIQRNHSYSTIFHKSKKYRINPDLFDEDFKKVEYRDFSPKEKQNDYVCKMTRGVLRMARMDKRAAKKFVVQYIKSGAIEKSLLINEEVFDGDNLQVFYKPYGKPPLKKMFCNRNYAIERAKDMGMDLIQDKRKIVIACKDKYIEQKKKRIKYSYNRHIENFSNRQFYASRNDINDRLDSNITSMPSVLLQFISLDEEPLINIDLSNSQFVFLAVLIAQGAFNSYLRQEEKAEKKLASKVTKIVRAENDSFSSFNQIKEQIVNGEYNNRHLYIERGTKRENKGGAYMCAENHLKVVSKNIEASTMEGDVEEFIQLAKNGKLYEYIRDNLKLKEGNEGRKQAKSLMFLIFFSKHDYRCSAKNKIKELFSTLISMIDLYKAEKREENKLERESQGLKDDRKGDNQFAIALQKKESSTFIDKILYKLFKSGFKVLSKHDSILCKKSDLEAVGAFIKQVLDKEIGENEYQLKND